MSSPTILSRIPALRILVPFIIGILIQRLWHCWWAPLVLAALAIGCYWLLVQKSRSPESRLRFKPYFIVPLAVGALALGWMAAIISCPPRLSENQLIDRILTGRVVHRDYTDFSMRLTVTVLDKDLPQCKVLISTRGCNYTIHPGDLVSWRAALTPVGNMGNPDEMDYASYLLDNKGIRYQQHLPVKQLRITGYSPTLITRMATVRDNLQLKVFNSELSPEAQQFVVALLLGNSSLIDKATRQEFSAAGVAHILALSGLHVGIIALIIWWLLFPFDYLRLKKLRLIVTICAIAAFAIFTGLSPSVVRATIMMAFVFASLIFYRKSVSLNALALAALVILIFTPSALYSVGFQLSFITVAAVLAFARLPQEFETRFKWANNLISTALTSLVAMLATIALSAYYFHTVSLLSVVANLLILPIMPVFMVLSALFLLVSAAGMHWQVLDWAIDTVYNYIHWAASAVSTLPLSHISGVYVSAFGVIAYFVIMALIILWFYRRDYRYLLASGIAFAVLLCHSLWIDARTLSRGLIIFNSFSSTPVFYYENGNGYVWTPDEEETDSAAFARYYSGFLARHNIKDLSFISNDDSLRQDGVMITPPQAYLMGHRILAAGSGKWKHMTTTKPLTLDNIIITKRFNSSATKLQELYHCNHFIVSGALHDADALLHECDSLGIKVHNLASQGAISYP